MRNIEWREYNTTIVTPLAIGFLILMVLLMLFSKKRHLSIPLILLAAFLPAVQRLVIGELDFTLLRILIIVFLLRILLMGGYSASRINRIDQAVLAYLAVSMVSYIILVGSFAAFINRLGFTLDVLGAYMVSRLTVRTWKDLRTLAKSLILVCIVIAAVMIHEQISGRNILSIFGGISEYAVVRDGKLRSQASFSHAIMAGTFGAMMLPLIWLIYHCCVNNRLFSVLGLLACLTIVMASASSGPIITLLTCVFGLSLWPFRRHVRTLWYGFIVFLFMLDCYMKAPIWHLIARVDLVGGSTGYHRYRLIDQAVNRVGEWFLFGTRQVASWGWGLQDITNQYIFEAVTGGLMKFLMFILIIVLAYKKLGRIMKAGKESNGPERVSLERLSWALGVSLMGHVTTFLGVSYFGQMVFFYYLLIGAIAGLVVGAEEKLPGPIPENIAPTLHVRTRHPLPTDRSAVAAGDR